MGARQARVLDPLLQFMKGIRTACRILLAEEWREAIHLGEVPPNPLDLEHGFIHLSPEEALRDTITLHFSRSEELVVLSLNVAKLGSALKWEHVASRDGAFPHLHQRAIPWDAIEWVRSGTGLDVLDAPTTQRPSLFDS